MGDELWEENFGSQMGFGGEVIISSTTSKKSMYVRYHKK